MHIKLSYENIEMLKTQHKRMMNWHKDRSQQSAVEAMWHKSKIEELDKIVNEQIVDEENVSNSMDEEFIENYMDEDKKADLIEILKDHIGEYGEMSKTIEEIISFIESD